MTFIKAHIFYLTLIVVGLVGFRCWLTVHDQNRDQAAQLAVEQVKVKTLTDQIAAINTAAALKTAAVSQTVKAVKTPAQAIAAIPDLSGIPLNARISPLDTTQVSVDAVALVQELGQCKTSAIQLDACTDREQTDLSIIAAKDKQLAIVAKPQKFWHRLLVATKDISIGIGIGVLLATRGL